MARLEQKPIKRKGYQLLWYATLETKMTLKTILVVYESNCKTKLLKENGLLTA